MSGGKGFFFMAILAKRSACRITESYRHMFICYTRKSRACLDDRGRACLNCTLLIETG